MCNLKENNFKIITCFIFISDLTNLVELDLSYNFLSSIPVGALADLNNLKFLNLGSNKIQVIFISPFLSMNIYIHFKYYVSTNLNKKKINEEIKIMKIWNYIMYIENNISYIFSIFILIKILSTYSKIRADLYWDHAQIYLQVVHFHRLLYYTHEQWIKRDNPWEKCF